MLRSCHTPPQPVDLLQACTEFRSGIDRKITHSSAKHCSKLVLKTNNLMTSTCWLLLPNSNRRIATAVCCNFMQPFILVLLWTVAGWRSTQDLNPHHPSFHSCVHFSDLILYYSGNLPRLQIVNPEFNPCLIGSA